MPPALHEGDIDMHIQYGLKDTIADMMMNGEGLSMSETLQILAASVCVGIYIFFIYKAFSRSQFYSKDLNVSMAGMTVVTAAIMIAMQSNLIVSLGMVGALSIVRFRTAVKSPLDLLYLFWAISAGIITGVGLLPLALILCAVMTLMIFLLSLIPSSRAPGLLVIRMKQDGNQEKIRAIIHDTTRGAKEQSVMIRNGECEMIYQIPANKQDELLKVLQKQKGILSLNWLEHHGEIRG